jgi:hypothetical protein
MRVSVISILASLASGLAAQDTGRVTARHRNAWYNYFGNHPLGERWGLHLEGQWRREGAGQTWMQLLLRQGVDFHLNPNVTLTGGYGYIRTYPYGDFPTLATFPEHRIWQQALVRHRLGAGVGMQHRYRLEQRNIGEMRAAPGEAARRVGWRYENRFRYLVRTDFALTRRDDRPDWYIATYNEMLINFGRNVAANVFDQNRAYAALGKALNRATRLEAGYMNQILQQRNGRVFEVNHTMMVSVQSTLRLRK